MTGQVEEQRYTLGLVYKADTPDAHGEYMTREELRKAAWDYAVNAHETGVFHADGTGGTGVPVESFLWPDGAPDWEVKDPDGQTVVVIKSGDWLMGNVWSPGAWQLIKSGRINGLSMQGVAVRRETPASVTKSRGRPTVPTKTRATGVPVQLVKAKIDRVDGVNGPANEVPFLVMKAAILPDDGDEMQPASDGEGDGVTVEVESGDGTDETGEEPEAAEVEPGETPGDTAWETQDSKSAEKAATLLAGIKAQIDDLIQREMAEAEDADVSMLEMACSDLDWVLGVIAKFVFTEQAEADAAKENPPADDNEAGDGSATDEEEAEDVTKAVEDIKAHFAAEFAELKKSLTAQAAEGAKSSTEGTATAVTEVVKQGSETDVSAVLKSVLAPALEPITKAVEQATASLANVSERLAKVEAQDAKGQPLLKGSAYWAGPTVPTNYGGMQPEAISKALAAISDPQERDKAGQALAVAMHPLMANQQ